MHHRGFVAHMTGALLAPLLAGPSASACVEALRPGPGTLAERAQVMVKACGALISSASCREAFGRFHDIGHRPLPLRKLVAACWTPYCRWDPEIPCDQNPGLVARFGTRERQWAMPARPVEDDYVRVEAWLERELGVSGLVDLAAEGPVQFAHIKML